MGHADRRLAELEMERVLPPQGQPRDRRFSEAAALRLWGVLEGTLTIPVPEDFEYHAPQREEPEPERAWSPLDDLDRQDTVRLRVLTYCSYVRCLITAEGLAAATGISRKQAQHALTDLRRAGKLYPASLLWNGRADAHRGSRVVWEWAGGDA